MKECICGLPKPCDTKCRKHGVILHGYPCEECHKEWRENYPLTAAAIAMVADPKVPYSKAQKAYREAKKAEPIK